MLRDLCLAHRAILPFAQEELFKRLDIRTSERMELLRRSTKESLRCEEYARRAESIFINGRLNLDCLFNGMFNPRELGVVVGSGISCSDLSAAFSR